MLRSLASQSRMLSLFEYYLRLAAERGAILLEHESFTPEQNEIIRRLQVLNAIRDRMAVNCDDDRPQYGVAPHMIALAHDR